MNEYTHAGRARLKVGCAGFYVAPDHLAIPIWIWILISIFVQLNVDSPWVEEREAAAATTTG